MKPKLIFFLTLSLLGIAMSAKCAEILLPNINLLGKYLCGEAITLTTGTTNALRPMEIHVELSDQGQIITLKADYLLNPNLEDMRAQISKLIGVKEKLTSPELFIWRNENFNGHIISAMLKYSEEEKFVMFRWVEALKNRTGAK